MNFNTCKTFTNTNTFVTWLEPSNNALTCRQMHTTSANHTSNMVLNTTNNTYIANHFNDTAEFFDRTDGNLTSSNNENIFIASIDSTATFAWHWATNNDHFDTVNGIPAHADNDNTNRATHLSVNKPDNNLYMGNQFTNTAVFGETDQLESRNLTDGVILTLSHNNRFPHEERWTIGVPMTPPPSTKFDDMVTVPNFRINDVSFNALKQKLFV